MNNTTFINLFFLLMVSLKGFPICKDTSHDLQKHPLTFMIMISSQEEEKQAIGLIKSIRTFGGIYSKAPVIIVLSDTIGSLGESLKGEVLKIVKLEMIESLRKFPFSDKVYACALVETMMENKTEWLVWLNPDAVMISPPSEFAADRNKFASLRPVHIKNIGIGYTEVLNDYWKKIYQYAKVDTNYLWQVKSFVDNKILRPYFNSGCMAFRPEIGILRQWKRVYELMLQTPDIYTFYLSDNYGAFFFHQAVLSAVIISMAGEKRINTLPDSYGYPLVLQNNQDFIHKKDSVSDMKIVLCGNYDNLNSLKAEEPYTAWFKKNLK